MRVSSPAASPLAVARVARLPSGVPASTCAPTSENDAEQRERAASVTAGSMALRVRDLPPGRELQDVRERSGGPFSVARSQS